MSEILDLLNKQSLWQKSRARLSWAEKLRLAETLREAALLLGPNAQKFVPLEHRTLNTKSPPSN